MDTSKLPISRVDELISKLDEINNRLISLENRRYIIETGESEDGNQWYRKWSDGWIEQGGKAITPTTGTTTVTYLKEFANAIMPVLGKSSSDASSWTTMTYNETTTSFTIKANLTGYQLGISWYACGQGA